MVTPEDGGVMPDPCPVCGAAYELDAAGRIVVTHDPLAHEAKRRAEPLRPRIGDWHDKYNGGGQA